MTRPTALPGLTPAEVKNLRDGDYPTVERLRARVARDGLDAALAGQSVRMGRLRRALVRYELLDAAGATPPWRRVLTFARVNLGVAALALFAALLVLRGVRALGRPEREVVAARDLPAFHVIGPGDVRERVNETDFNTFPRASDVVGRVALGTLSEGDPVRRDGLSRVLLRSVDALRGRRILSLPLARRSLPLAVPGTRADLLLPPDQAAAHDSSLVVGDVLVLNADEDAPSVVVAVWERDLPKLARSVGAAEVVLVQTVTAPAVSPPAAPAPRPPAPPASQR